MNWFPKMLLLFCIRRAYGDGERKICGETESTSKVACEGQNIEVECPAGTPWIQIGSALYGREQPEYVVCARPGNNGQDQSQSSESYSCELDVSNKVSDICEDKKKCNFNVTNSLLTDPCPKVYKYLSVIYKCMCSKRYPRKKEPSTTQCYSRSSVTQRPTVIGSPTLATTTQYPITLSTSSVTSGATPQFQSIRVTPTSPATVATTVSGNVTVPKRTMKVNMKRQTFFILLELFVIYNETYEENPSMAIIWCFIGILFGLFTMIIIFLLMSLARKPKDKRLCRLSQLETNERNIQSPTIETNSLLPESPQRRYETEIRKKVSNVDGGRKQEERKSLKNNDPSYNANPIIYLKSKRKHEESTTERSSKGNPNTSKTPEDEETGATSTSSEARNNSSEPTEAENRNDLQETSMNTQNKSPEIIKKKSLQNCASDQDRASNAQCGNDTANIPVGIPSHPISVDSLLLNNNWMPSGTQKDKPSESLEDNTRPLIRSKPRDNVGGNLGYPSPNLLSRFGVNNDSRDTRPSHTTLSSPCLYNKPFNQEMIRGPSGDNQDIGQDTKDGSGNAINNTKPARSLSLDSSYHSEIPLLGKPYSDHMFRQIENTKCKNQHTIATQNANTPSLAPKLSNLENTSNGQYSSQKPNKPKYLEVTPRSKTPRTSRSRESSGYYSNSTSPSVEYSMGSDSSQNPLKPVKKSCEKKQTKESHLKDKQSLNTSDDLPPLPPPPAPLLPPSPLPHLFALAIQSPRSKTPQEKHKERSPSRTGVRKVHFEPPTT